jgi:hypothetical protein
MFIFPRVFSENLLSPYRDAIWKNYCAKVSEDSSSWDSWETKSITFSNDDDIVSDVKHYLQKYLKIELNCFQVEGQIWPINGSVGMHKHSESYYRSSTSKYNSMLYLNQDFDGGEFVTEHGITLKPQTGTLTFFDGVNVLHGPMPVSRQHRFTLIFWWDIKSEFV